MKHLAFLALFSVFTAPAHGQTVELLHFWDEPGERAALDVFAESFRKRGGTWYDTARANEVTLRSYALERILNGYAPTAVQWHGGPDIKHLLDLEITHPLSAILPDTTQDALHPFVASILGADDGAIGALPVGLHGENWAWHSLPIYHELGLDLPKDWEDFLRMAPTIRAAGYRPLAVGRGAWERASIFKTILIDTGGVDLYMRMLNGQLDEKADRAAITAAFKLMLRLRDEATSSEHAHANWNDSTADVMAGRAAMQIMGDWAKGEFLNAGKVIGQDFACALAPGNHGTMSIILDVFVLPKTDDPALRLAQATLAETVLDPKTQHRFALTKGALPVVKGVELAAFDPCAKTGIAHVSKAGSTVPSVSLSLDQEQVTRIYDAIQTVWETGTITPEAACALFFKRIMN